MYSYSVTISTVYIMCVRRIFVNIFLIVVFIISV